MAYQLSDLIAEVQTKSKDSSFDSTLITYYLNDTQNSILGQRMFPFMETSVTVALGEGDTSYSYPVDLQSIVGLRLSDPVDTASYIEPDYLPHRIFFDMYPTPESYGESAPTAYTDYGRTLLWSCPLAESYSMYLRYLKRPTDLSGSTDVPALPQEFKAILVLGALAGVEEYRRNFDVAAVHRRTIEDLTEDLVLRYSPRNLTRMHKVGNARFIKR